MGLRAAPGLHPLGLSDRERRVTSPQKLKNLNPAIDLVRHINAVPAVDMNPRRQTKESWLDTKASDEQQQLSVRVENLKIAE